jgi:hypothetical protein
MVNLRDSFMFFMAENIPHLHREPGVPSGTGNSACGLPGQDEANLPVASPLGDLGKGDYCSTDASVGTHDALTSIRIFVLYGRNMSAEVGVVRWEQLLPNAIPETKVCFCLNGEEFMGARMENFAGSS